MNKVNLMRDIQLYGGMCRNAEYWYVKSYQTQDAEKLEEFQRNRDQSEKRAEEIFAEIKNQIEGNDENNKR